MGTTIVNSDFHISSSGRHDEHWWEDIQHEWLSQLDKVCALKTTTEGTKKNCRCKQFILDPKHKALYCFTPKVGSTTWKYTLLKLNSINGTVDVDNVHNRQLFSGHPMTMLGYTNMTRAENEAVLRDDQNVRFTFVRHPIERLISAYRDKFEPGFTWFYRRLGTTIIRTFRKNATRESFVTFPEFVKFVI